MPDPKGAAAEPQPKPNPQQQQQPSDEQDPPAARSYSQEEVDRIADKVRRNAKRDAELRLRREMQSAPAPQPQAPKKEELAEDVEPKRDDFDTHEDYQRALTKFDATQAAREERKKADDESRKRTEQEKQDKARDTWKGKVERAMAKHEDFEDVLEDNAETFELIANAPMRQFMTESDIGPEIAYYLCKTEEGRADAKRIVALPGYKQAAEIAKIEDKLTAAAAPKPDEEEETDHDETPEAKAAREELARDKGGRFQKKDPPEPIEPGSGRPANNSSAPSDKDDAETWRRKELARMRKAQGK